jgi:hypothetical protein
VNHPFLGCEDCAMKISAQRHACVGEASRHSALFSSRPPRSKGSAKRMDEIAHHQVNATTLMNISRFFVGGSCSSADDAQMQTLLLSAVLGFVVLAAVGIALLLWRWDSWYSHSASAAFLLVDRDGSGAVDKEELYVGVLELYAAVPIKVHPPSRALVSELLSHLDLDRSEHLNADEFAHVMAVLSAQLLGRLVITLLFLLACPVTGGVLWTLLVDWATDTSLDGLDVPEGANAGGLRPALRHGLPHWLRCSGSIFAQLHLGPPLLTVVLMLPLDCVVQFAERVAARLIARGWCFSDREAASPGFHGRDSINGSETLRRKSQIVHQVSMVRHASAWLRMSQASHMSMSSASDVLRLSSAAQLDAPLLTKSPGG